MVEITFESHGTTIDNELGLASGHFDANLSKLGKKQAQNMGERYKNEAFDAIFTSDLKRAFETARVAFGEREIEIIKDSRLRECNYGDFNRHPNSEVEPLKIKHILEPFPNGESFAMAVNRVNEFLEEVIQNYAGKKILIIDHRVTWYALEMRTKNKTIEDLVIADWKWQPGWKYQLQMDN